MGLVKTCTKCGRDLLLENFYKSPTGKYGVYSVCKECQKKECKKHYLHNLEKKRAMYRTYNQKRAEREKQARENEERLELLKASEILGGYRIYILNHVKEGESKYTCVKVSTAEVYQTSNKSDFFNYLRGILND